MREEGRSGKQSTRDSVAGLGSTRVGRARGEGHGTVDASGGRSVAGRIGLTPRISCRAAARRLHPMLRPPIPVSGAVWTREHDGISIRVPEPELPMIRATVPVWGIPVPRPENVGLQLLRPRPGRVKVIDFKPEQHPVARRQVGVPEGAVMVLHVPAVELEHQPATLHQPLVVRTSLVAYRPAVRQPAFRVGASLSGTEACPTGVLSACPLHASCRRATQQGQPM